MRAQTVALAVVVTALCIVGTLTAFAVGNLLDEGDRYPTYTVEGDYDGVPFTGTATCHDTEESSRQTVLEFSYTLGSGDGAAVITSYLIMEDGTPVDIYRNVGTSETLGRSVTLWTDPDGWFTYHVSDGGDVLAVDISKDGVIATAVADQA